mmetsp:Transcript_81052/g.242860  ORF Transcript_81052/g.242860 Transcript_81052/m.242860 type:complete len:171 (-) Transcript_81052:153-665(-)
MKALWGPHPIFKSHGGERKSSGSAPTAMTLASEAQGDTLALVRQTEVLEDEGKFVRQRGVMIGGTITLLLVAATSLAIAFSLHPPQDPAPPSAPPPMPPSSVPPQPPALPPGGSLALVLPVSFSFTASSMGRRRLSSITDAQSLCRSLLSNFSNMEVVKATRTKSSNSRL